MNKGTYVRLTTEERKQLRMRAAKLDLSMSEVLRLAVNKYVLAKSEAIRKAVKK